MHHAVEDLEQIAANTRAFGSALARAAIAALLVIAVLAAAVLTTGCASGRYVTDEQDAELREACEPAGCRVVPAPLWQRIEQLLRALGGSPA